MTVANGKKLDAAHNKWLRRILQISLRDKITYKQGGMGKDGTGRYRKHHKKKKTTFDRTRGENEWRNTGYMPWTGARKERIKEADRERTGRKLYLKTSCMDATWREAIDLAEVREGCRDCVARCA